jgi:hypothetical protein
MTALLQAGWNYFRVRSSLNLFERSADTSVRLFLFAASTRFQKVGKSACAPFESDCQQACLRSPQARELLQPARRHREDRPQVAALAAGLGGDLRHLSARQFVAEGTSRRMIFCSRRLPRRESATVDALTEACYTPSTMHDYLADLTDVTSYEVWLEFTERLEPSELSVDPLPFVPVKDEITANSATAEGEAMRKEHGRIPYGAPLYLWEVETCETRSAGELYVSDRRVVYVGQTMHLTAQKRFEQHASVMKILAAHVNIERASVYFRLCSRLDLIYRVGDQTLRRAIEHFPLEQACSIVDDIEAYIIFHMKPQYNTHYKNRAKVYQRPFKITKTKNIFLA